MILHINRIIILSLIIIAGCKETNQASDVTFAQVVTKMDIDGHVSEMAWDKADWRDIDNVWLGGSYNAEDFSGRYKTLWSKDRLYVVAEIIDDTLVDIHPDGLERYWDDDCLEVFVDVDASGGNHQYNYNAFAYHIGLDGKVVDIGVDSLPHYYNHVVSAMTHKGNMTTWELSIALYDESFERNKSSKEYKLSAGHDIGFAIAYCDNDHSQEREHFIGSVAIKGEDKNRGWIDAGIFERVTLVE